MEDVILRVEFRGVVSLDGEWPEIGQEVTVIGRGLVTGQTTDEEAGGPVTRAKLKMASAELAIVPPPPGLFDDVDKGLETKRNFDPETGEIS